MSRRLEIELDSKLAQHIEELVRMRTRGSGKRMTPADVIAELIQESYDSFRLQEMISRSRW